MFRSSEQTKFSSVLLAHIADPDAPLLIEGGTGIGKTRAYLAAIKQSGKRIAIVLPTHVLIDQLLASKDLLAVGLEVVTFRPARMFASRPEYEAQRQVARNAQVMICTAASVIIDQRLQGEYNGATEREVLLFDEADQLPDMAALQSDFVIERDMLKAPILRESLERLSTGRAAEPEVRAAARVMIEILDEPVGYARVGVDDEGAARLHHYLPGRLMKIISNRQSTIFVSATLSNSGTFKHFQTAMGIESSSRLSCTIEPERHGRVAFSVAAHEVGTDAWFAAILENIKAAARPLLVATTSHDLTARIVETIGALDAVTVKAGAWAGLDMPTPPRTIIVPTVPYSQPVVIDGEVTSSYLDARVTATRRLRQVLGRGLRTPDADCTMVVLDGRAQKLDAFVPARFSIEWTNRRVFDEGARAEIVLSKAERDPALRRSALKHYGCQCRYDGCTVADARMLDVHHLDPVAEGVRRTTLKDVTVLCANHHRLAHAEMRSA
jgi:Rad3-related DNA helicase